MARPALKRHAVDYVVGHYGTSRRRACRLACQHRSVHYYRSRRDPRTALRTRLRELAQVRIRYGYRRLQVLLRREGWSAGKNLIYRLYTEESLKLRSKRPRHRKMVVGRRERYEPKRPNQAWSMDFVADQLVNGTRFRALPIVDVFTREALDIVVAQRLRSEHVVEACNRLVASRGAPVRIFVDNGSEFSGRVFDLWAYHCGAAIDFNRPGKPTDNCFIETIDEAKAKIEAWRKEYNESRPHQALSELTPSESAVKSRHLSTSGVIRGAET